MPLSVSAVLYKSFVQLSLGYSGKKETPLASSVGRYLEGTGHVQISREPEVAPLPRVPAKVDSPTFFCSSSLQATN